MLVIMEEGATQEQIEEVIQRIRSLEYECHPMQGDKGLVIGATGNGKGRHRLQVSAFPEWNGLFPSHLLTSWPAERPRRKKAF